MKVADVVTAIGVDEATCYRRMNEHGGMKVSQVKRLRELEKEDARLRKAVAHLTLDKSILQQATRGSFCAPNAAVRARSVPGMSS